MGDEREHDDDEDDESDLEIVRLGAASQCTTEDLLAEISRREIPKVATDRRSSDPRAAAKLSWVDWDEAEVAKELAPLDTTPRVRCKECRSEAETPATVTHDPSCPPSVRVYANLRWDPAAAEREAITNFVIEHREWARDPGRFTPDEAKVIEGALNAVIRFCEERR